MSERLPADIDWGSERTPPRNVPAPPNLWREDEGVPSATSPQPRAPAEPPREHHRRPTSPAGQSRSYLVTYGGLLLMLFAADAVYVAATVRNPMQEARQALEAGVAQLSDGSVDLSRNSFSKALVAAEHAGDLTRHPSVILAALAPRIGTDARALRAISLAEELSARAGLLAADAAEAVALEDDGLAASVYEDGELRLAALQQSQSPVGGVASLLATAGDTLAEVREPSLSAVREALLTAKEEIGNARTSAGKMQTLINVLPRLLGADSPRRYLLVFQALGEARGTGGVIGVYGVLSAHDGRIQLQRVGDPVEVLSQPIAPGEAPAWFEQSYGPYPLQQWSQTNLSPSFPVVAQILLGMQKATTGRRLDGVIAMDALALEDLLPGAQPIQSRFLPTPIDATNVRNIVLQDAYTELDPITQDQFLADVITQFWEQVRTGDIDVEAMSQGLVEATRSQHFKIYLDSPELQNSIGLLGADGDFASAGPNVQLLFHNNYSTSKVDVYLRRSIDTTVALSPEGDARVVTSLTLENQAPSGPPSPLLIGDTETKAGTNLMTLHLLLPQGAEVEDLSINGNDETVSVYEEAGFPVVWKVLEIPGGDVAEASVTYTMPRAASLSSTHGTFDFTLFPQATVSPDRFSLTILPPKGFLFLSSEDSAQHDRLELAGWLSEPTTTRVEMVKQ